MTQVILKIITHLLPLTFGVGSLILKVNGIDGWGWFFGASIIFGLIISVETDKKD